MKKILFATLIVTILASFSSDNNPNVHYYFGNFKIKKNLNYYGSEGSFTSFMAGANVYPDSVNSYQLWNSNKIGTIYYNDVPLMYNSMVRTYYDTVQRKVNPNINWAYYDEMGHLLFNETQADTFPNIGNLDILPDNLDKSKPFHVNFQSASFADEYEITMHDGQFRIRTPFYRNVPSNIKNVVIPPSDLVSLSGDYVTVTLSLKKIDYKTINRKEYRFEREFNFIKVLKLIN